MPEHREPAGKRADQLVDEDRPDEGGHEALGDVEEDDGDPVAASVGAPHVRRADVAAARGANVLPLHDPHRPVAERHGAEQVGPDEHERGRHGLT